MSRLKKIAMDAKEIEFAVNSLLEQELQIAAQEIGFTYDDGVFAQVENDPKYQQIIFEEIPAIYEKIKYLVDQWTLDTQRNYSNELNVNNGEE